MTPTDAPDQKTLEMQRCNHCMTIQDEGNTECEKCGRDDALMYPFESTWSDTDTPDQKAALDEIKTTVEYDSGDRSVGLPESYNISLSPQGYRTVLAALQAAQLPNTALQLPPIEGLEEAITFVGDCAEGMEDEGLDRDNHARHFRAAEQAARAYLALSKGYSWYYLWQAIGLPNHPWSAGITWTIKGGKQRVLRSASCGHYPTPKQAISYARKAAYEHAKMKKKK